MRVLGWGCLILRAPPPAFEKSDRNHSAHIAHIQGASCVCILREIEREKVETSRREHNIENRKTVCEKKKANEPAQ